MNGPSLEIPGIERIGPGTHLCALYSGPAERDHLVFSFLEDGMRHGDKVLCLIDGVEPAIVLDRVLGRPAPGDRREAQIDVERAADAYLCAGRFDGDLMVAFLAERVDAAVTAGFALLRAVGDMSWAMHGSPGCDDLFVYESTLDRVATQVPAIFMCLYDLTQFGADVLVDVLHTHRQVLMDRTMTDNPYYRGTEAPLLVPPEGRVTDDLDDGWGTLTRAELRVASLVARGMTNRMIAEDLYISRHTVDAHLKHVYLKLLIHSRVELTVLALQHRLPAG